VRDGQHIESAIGSAPGLALLPLETSLDASKTLRRVDGMALAREGFWGCLANIAVRGYEIHLGHTTDAGTKPLLQLDERADGAVVGDVAGTYVHGLFETEPPRTALVGALAARRGFARHATTEPTPDPYDRLADVLEQTLDLRPLTVIPTRG
jgi:adenosylcobyric acid synthase